MFTKANLIEAGTSVLFIMATTTIVYQTVKLLKSLDRWSGVDS